MSKLVIVESPAKAKTIGKYLGSDYVVKASMGHLRDLPRKTMGVDIDHDFKPEYIPIEGKDKIINELRDAAAHSDFVYLATDPDREGEAISWHLKNLLHLTDKNSKRVTFNEITKNAVQQGIAHPRDIDIDLVDAQQARRILDRIVGYKLSPFLWKKVRRGLSAGRVQSVATRMVVDREREIRAFIPEEYWSIDSIFSQNDHKFPAYFYGTSEKKMELKNEEETQKVMDAITGQPFTVGTVKKGKKKKSPMPPFTTSTLQQEASRKLNMTPRRTMSVAQELYEGIEIEGRGMTGLITYMRTDSLRLSAEAIAAAKELILSKYGPEYYPAKTRVFKTKNNAQDAHEAIRPSDATLTPEMLTTSLNRDQLRLYRLIWSRFVACQMAEAQLDTVTADIVSGDYVFRATGYTVRFPGYTAVYEESGDDDSKSPVGGKPLPELAEGMPVKAEELKPNQHFTQPPARYTEASLIKAMEEKGIGRPSTYAPTISTILDRDYVVKEKKALRPTPLGEGVTDLMVDKFQSVSDLKFTANMENQLDEVESGKVPYLKVLHDFYDGFDQALTQAEKDLENTRIKIKDEETNIVCDQCGRNMVIKTGRFGKFLACPGFPECKNTKPLAEETGALCPICGGKVLKKKSKRGYGYYGCEHNPECGFMTWDVPTKEQCPQCGSSIFKHTDRDSKEVSNVCLKEGCGYKEIIKEGLPPEEAEKARQRREARAAKMAERRAQKEAEKQAAKEAEKAAKQAAKEAERAAKKAAREAEKARIAAEKKAAKEAERAAKKAAKEEEKARLAAEKKAAREAEKARIAAEKKAAKEAAKKEAAKAKKAAAKKTAAKKTTTKKTTAKKTTKSAAAKKTEE